VKGGKASLAQGIIAFVVDIDVLTMSKGLWNNLVIMQVYIGVLTLQAISKSSYMLICALEAIRKDGFQYLMDIISEIRELQLWFYLLVLALY
jgi:hypothetical protein